VPPAIAGGAASSPVPFTAAPGARPPRT
jgi:hypothetical protein